MKQLLIYQRPVQLNRQLHRDHRVLPLDNDYRFASQVNSAPLACSEFAHAARQYPIVFAGASLEAVVPAALLGLMGLVAPVYPLQNLQLTLKLFYP